MVFSLCAEKFQAYGTCEPDCKRAFFRENQIAGYELEYPDGHAVCVFYNPWEKKLCRNFRKELETALRWKTLRRGWSRDERKHDASGKIDGSAGAGVKL